MKVRHRHYKLIVKWLEDVSQPVWVWDGSQSCWALDKEKRWLDDFYALGDMPVTSPFELIEAHEITISSKVVTLFIGPTKDKEQLERIIKECVVNNVEYTYRSRNAPMGNVIYE